MILWGPLRFLNSDLKMDEPNFSRKPRENIRGTIILSIRTNCTAVSQPAYKCLEEVKQRWLEGKPKGSPTWEDATKSKGHFETLRCFIITHITRNVFLGASFDTRQIHTFLPCFIVMLLFANYVVKVLLLFVLFLFDSHRVKQKE